jgi:hypothetical protein
MIPHQLTRRTSAALCLWLGLIVRATVLHLLPGHRLERSPRNKFNLFFRLYTLLYEIVDIEVYVERMAKITIVSNVTGTGTGWLIYHLVYCLFVRHLSVNECCEVPFRKS